MALPLLLSVPHAGLAVPPEAAPWRILSAQEIAEDGDAGAAEIYDLADQVQAYATTSVARAFVDLNRAENDRRKDGVVKTHTCWDVPVYDPFPPEEVIETLLALYYRPYHARLRALAGSGALLGVDCHTMAAVGPPVGPDPGVERPWVCLSNADGTCSDAWLTLLADSFNRQFGDHVEVNHPFQGGYIIRAHAAEMPWVQLELSRAPFMPDAGKRARVLAALADFLRRLA